MDNNESRYEEFRISGEEAISKIKEILREGNARRLILKDDKGVTLIEIPLTMGVIGAVLVPVWAAIGAIAAVAAKLTLVVEKREPPEADQ